MHDPQKEQNESEAGWTFIETLICMAIILILTAAVGFSAIKKLDQARIVTARNQIETFCIALDSYYLDCGEYPTQEQGLEALWKKSSGGVSDSNWDGPYLQKDIPLDPWENQYEYMRPGYNGLPYGIRCFGKDGMEGGEGNDADITSWE
jgi:general secretion pathway protein G